MSNIDIIREMYPEKLIFTRAEMAKIIGMGYSTTSRLLEQNRADELPKSKKSGGPKKIRHIYTLQAISDWLDNCD